MNAEADDAADARRLDTATNRVGGPARQGRRLAIAAVAFGFGLLYAWDLVEAVSNLVGVAALNSLAAEAGVAPVVPWALPIAAVALPVFAFAIASLLASGRGLGIRALLLATGLATVAAVTATLTALV